MIITNAPANLDLEYAVELATYEHQGTTWRLIECTKVDSYLNQPEVYYDNDFEVHYPRTAWRHIDPRITPCLLIAAMEKMSGP